MKKPICLILAVLFTLAVFGCKMPDKIPDKEPDKKKPLPSYIVVYNANGGNGTMENSTHVIGTANNLSINTYTRNGYTFIGWANSSTGTIIYTDGEEVTDLSTTTGATVTLYARWNIITIVPGSNLAEKLAWLQTNAQSNIDYNIEITANEDIYPTTLVLNDKTNVGIILTGTETERIIGLLSAGSLFTVGEGVTLTLNNNITLRGLTFNNNASLISVDRYGTLIMNQGARIINNSVFPPNRDPYSGGGGVNVAGTFIMNGGEISGNTADNSDSLVNSDYIISSGGGVIVGGTFTMNGGKIFGNSATTTARRYGHSMSSTSRGGGVFVAGTFIMNGGEISGNTASSSNYYDKAYSMGGGVSVGVFNDATFIMNGGEISDNTVVSDSPSATSVGGGVSIGNYTNINGGIFIMQGGKVSGNTAILKRSNSVTSSADGGGIHIIIYSTFRIINGIIYGSGEASNIKNTASSSGAAIYIMSNNKASEYGTFSGNTWIKNGSLSTTDNTIRVVNGALQ